MENNTQRDFKALVSEMRAAQRAYFRTRTTEALQRSKYLERLVDEELKRMNEEKSQPTLFD